MSAPNPCRHFRNKKMFVPGMDNDAVALENDPNGLTHCWCNRTQRELGTDNEPVNLRDCSLVQRSCFEPR